LEKPTTKFSCFTDGASDFVFDSTLYQPQPYGILCSYAIGDKADDLNAVYRADPGELKRLIQKDLALIFPRLKPNAVDICAQPWQADEYTQGAYALYRPGQWFGIRAILQEPHLRVYFAGEHLADEHRIGPGNAPARREKGFHNWLRAAQRLTTALAEMAKN
jgi:monoamine oxidase